MQNFEFNVSATVAEFNFDFNYCMPYSFSNPLY